MSGPVMSPTSRTRADWALYGPSSGKPSTIASALGARPRRWRTASTGAVQPGHVDDGEVAVGVVDDDPAVVPVAVRPRPTPYGCRRPRARWSSRARGRRRSRSPRCAGRSSAPYPSTLTTDCRALTHHLRAGQRRVGRGHLAGAGRRQVAEHVREAAGVDGVAQRLGQRLRLLAASPCRRRRAAALLRTALASHGSDDEPSGTATSQATSSTASSGDDRAADVVEPPAGAAGDRAPQLGAEPAGQRLAEHREPEDRDQRDDDPDRAVGEPVGEQRTELQADQRAAEEADEREQHR